MPPAEGLIVEIRPFFFAANLIFRYVFENKTEEHSTQKVSDKIWLIRKKIFPFKIKRQVKSVFLSDVKRTVVDFPTNLF